MSLQQITPKQRGYLIANSHPDGCAEVVKRTWESIPPRTPEGRTPVVLLLGSSAGYGMSILLAGLRRHSIRGVGVAFEGAPSERRTGTAGWYRTAATAELAAGTDTDFVFVNADAFSSNAKEQALDLIAERFGPVDHLIYSLAAPRRTDPVTGEVHHSVIKPIGEPYEAASLVFPDGVATVGTVQLTPANEAEQRATMQVMGGADWQLWVEALAARGLLGDGFTTVALSYVGSDITAPVYRQGTIGAAKEHLEATARTLADGVLADGAGRAFTVVAGAAVTQASTAIPSIALYTSLLHNVLGGEGWHTTADQAIDLWSQLAGEKPLVLDRQGRIRLDGWELDEKVQEKVRKLWADPTAALADEPAGAEWFYNQFRALYGWDVPGVDYGADVETAVAWPDFE
ncbi:trans-2-enoyl-CoA reductase [Kitasatospora cheerisanensis]|uniref:trans-2-enoyl-CoA reductase (NAD(+)) n=1 Tax=Kitasatospora cheerisanensis KCTC 2395 TaxID=1348663 RepID=A0A066Z6B2_9ACTN|nr:trans-2-enoyl-CoA reductase [Kitasatospora cheerisanensis]KDN85670.1 trans-2-enoyl-CoA reductase [Kitasatospora cheerisanensis KCTC 2395]